MGGGGPQAHQGLRGQWARYNRTAVGAAGDLQVGDRLRTEDGQDVTITALRYYTGYAHVYTLTVANDHDFFVSVDQVLVHNADGEACPVWPWGEAGYQGPKAIYEDPGHHTPGSGRFRGGGSQTSVIPADAQAAFDNNAIPDPRPQIGPRTWWAEGANGVIYRYQGSYHGDGPPIVHWNGSTATDRGLVVPKQVREYFRIKR